MILKTEKAKARDQWLPKTYKHHLFNNELESRGHTSDLSSPAVAFKYAKKCNTGITKKCTRNTVLHYLTQLVYVDLYYICIFYYTLITRLAKLWIFI